MSKILKLIAIKTKDKVFVSDNVESKSYFSSTVGNLLFDGSKPKSTFVSHWYELSQMPKEIQRIIAPQRLNQRYELMEGYPVTEATPQIIYESYIDDESEYYDVRGLYQQKYELTEETFEPVEFEVVILDEINGFVPVNPKFDLHYGLLDKLQVHPVLLPTKPCSLSAAESYKIIRQYVKENIDPKVAEITSDYDFCFTVKKKVRLANEEQYRVDISSPRAKKPKYETRYRKYRSVEIYEVAPKAYQSYPIVTPFIGKDYNDLQKNIEEFLSDLMKDINEPVVECSCCGGTGVIFKEVASGN